MQSGIPLPLVPAGQRAAEVKEGWPRLHCGHGACSERHPRPAGQDHAAGEGELAAHPGEGESPDKAGAERAAQGAGAVVGQRHRRSSTVSPRAGGGGALQQVQNGAQREEGQDPAADGRPGDPAEL